MLHNMALYLIAILSLPMMTLCAYQDPAFMWPLNENSYVSETMSNVVQDNTQCGIDFKEDLYSRDVLTLDGSEYPYVDLVVGSSTGLGFTADTTFAFHVYLDELVKGWTCFFHLRKDTYALNTLEQIKMCVDSDGMVAVNLTSDAGEEHYQFSTVLLSVKRWYQLAVTMDVAPNAKIALLYKSVGVNNANDEVIGALISWLFDSPATLRIGADLDGTNLLQGAVACFGIFSKKLGKNDLATLESKCSTDIWNYAPLLPSPGTDYGCLTTTTKMTTEPATKTTEAATTTTTTESLSTTTTETHSTSVVQLQDSSTCTVSSAGGRCDIFSLVQKNKSPELTVVAFSQQKQV